MEENNVNAILENKTHPPKLRTADGQIYHSEFASSISTWFQHLTQAFGVKDKEAAALLLSQLVSGNYRISSANTETINGLIAAVSEMEPEDPAESMLAIQMATCHTHIMKMLARITKANAPVGSDVVKTTMLLADRLMRTYTKQMETLARYRRKGMQKMTVEHITVENGGQAIVGSVDRRRG